MTALLTQKTEVQNYNNLPTTGNTYGDYRYVINDGKQYFWSTNNSSGERSFWKPEKPEKLHELTNVNSFEATTGQALTLQSDGTWRGTSVSSTNTWIYYAATWTTPPQLIQAITGGNVYEYTLNGTTRYRFVPNPYNATTDTFYENFTSGVLNNPIVSRGQ